MICKSSSSQMFSKIGVLKNFTRFTKKQTPVSEFLFNKFTSLKSWSFIKKRLLFSCEFCVSFYRTPRPLPLEMPCRICCCKLYRLSCCNDIKLKEHLEMDIAHIISSHLRFDLIEMYLLKKQRLKCICVLIGQTVAANFFVAN